MKHLRLWLLLLIAFVLPLRGTLAFGMTLPGSAHASHVVGHMQAMGGCHHADQLDSDKQSGHHPGHDAACCNAAAMTHEPPALQGAMLCGAVSFAPLQAPTVSFQSEGPERPPRTI